MVSEVINSWDFATAAMYWLFGILFPSLFFGAILAWTVADGRYLSSSGDHPSKFSHSEPLVLMFIGAFFLYLNMHHLEKLPLATLEILARVPGLTEPDNRLSVHFAYVAYSLATFAICASLAKAFWTHVRLEQGCWGAFSYYGAFHRRHGAIRGIELALRCIIAILVVYLQKHLMDLKHVPYIRDINGSGLSEEHVVQFVQGFSDWEGHLAELFMCMYFVILGWVILAFFMNRHARKGDEAEALKEATQGTLKTTLPGFAIAYLLFVTATGRWIPFFAERIKNLAGQFILLSTCLLGALSIYVLWNLFAFFLWQVCPVVRSAWTDAYGKKGPPPAPV